MKIKATQFPNLLKQQLHPIYIISGDEPFQKEEVCFLIRTQAKQAGMYEHLIYHADAQFDWSLLEEAVGSISLFAEKRLTELRFPDGNKMTKTAERALLFYAKHLSPENILILICHKISKTIEYSSWFKQLESAGLWIPVWPIEGKFLLQWINERVRRCGLEITMEATSLLAERTEGNLLAASQEIEKLCLLSTNKKITRQQVNSVVADNAHYDTFGLIDAILACDVRHAVRMYRRLCAEGIELTSILGIIVRELRILNQLACLLSQKMMPDAAIKKISEEQNIVLFILQRKRYQYLSFINRQGIEKISQLIINAADVDSNLKKRGDKFSYNKLLNLILQATGVQL